MKNGAENMDVNIGAKGLKRGVGSGIAKVAGSRRKRKQYYYTILHGISRSKRCKKVATNKKGWELGLKGRENHRITNLLLPCTYLIV